MTTREDHRRARESGDAAATRLFASHGILFSQAAGASFLAGMVRAARRLHASYESDGAAAVMLIDEARLVSPETCAALGLTDDTASRRDDEAAAPPTAAPRGASSQELRSQVERLGGMRQAKMIQALFRAGFDTAEIATFTQSDLDESQVAMRMHLRVIGGADRDEERPS